MPAKWKKKFKSARKQFKNDLRNSCSNNYLLAICIIKTYSSFKHRKYIGKFHEFLGTNNFELWKEYCNQGFFGKYLTGKDDIWNTMYFANRRLYDKYSNKIHSNLALGDAYGVSLDTIRKKETKNRRKLKSGSYRRMGSGAYEICISLGFKNKKRIRKYKTVHVNTDKEAEKELELFLEEYN